MDIEDVLIKGLFVLCTPAIVLMLVFIIVAPFGLVYTLFNPGPSITLVKSDWSCVNTRTRMIGKVIQTQCIDYQLTEANK